MGCIALSGHERGLMSDERPPAEHSISKKILNEIHCLPLALSEVVTE